MSVAPLPAIALPAAHAGAAVQTQAAAADVVVPIHLQLGNSAVNVVLGVAADINTLEQAVNAYLNENSWLASRRQSRQDSRLFRGDRRKPGPRRRRRWSRPA